jgi:hypothetical protein
MSKLKATEWLSETLELEDIETLTAFIDWMRSNRKESVECLISQEAWAELLERSEEDMLH